MTIETNEYFDAPKSDDEEEELQPHCYICYNMNMNINITCFNCRKTCCKNHCYCVDRKMPYCSRECFLNIMFPKYLKKSKK